MPEKAALTYESLFELLRLEKESGELQKLDPGFLDDLKAYLSEKVRAATVGDVDAEELERRSRQLANIRKLVRELFERREKKIVQLALSKTRVDKLTIDSSALLPQEKAFFDSLVRLFLENRTAVLLPILNTQLALSAERKSEGVENTAPAASVKANKDEPASWSARTAQLEHSASQGLKKVRFLRSVPQFVGPDLDIYGPFELDETAELPPEICAVLVDKRNAEELK